MLPLFGSRHHYPSTKEGVLQTLMNEYAAIVSKYKVDFVPKRKATLHISDADKSRLEEIYKQMSPAQQQRQTICFMYPPDVLPMSRPKQSQLDLWKNAKIYGVWIDDKRINNSDLEKYKPADFSFLSVSRLMPIAVKNDKFRYQIELMTVDHYNKYREDALAKRDESILVYHMTMTTKNRKGKPVTNEFLMRAS